MEKSKKVSAVSLSLLKDITLTSRAFWNDAYFRFNREYKFSANALEIIDYLSRNPKCSQDDILKNLRLDKGVVAKIMHSLTQQEYVQRQYSINDRRRYELTLLPAGTEVASRIRRFADDWIRHKSGSVDEADIEAYLRVLNALHSEPREYNNLPDAV